MAKRDQTLTTAQLARMLAVGLDRFRSRFRQHIPTRLEERRGRSIRFQPEAVRAILDAEVARAESAAARRFTTDDLDLDTAGGSDSPALERYRAARAKQEEIKLSQMRGEVLDVHTFRVRTDGLCVILRSAVERVERRFGSGPAEVLTEAIDQWAEEIGKAIRT